MNNKDNPIEFYRVVGAFNNPQFTSIETLRLTGSWVAVVDVITNNRSYSLLL